VYVCVIIPIHARACTPTQPPPHTHTLISAYRFLANPPWLSLSLSPSLSLTLFLCLSATLSRHPAATAQGRGVSQCSCAGDCTRRFPRVENANRMLRWRGAAAHLVGFHIDVAEILFVVVFREEPEPVVEFRSTFGHTPGDVHGFATHDLARRRRHDDLHSSRPALRGLTPSAKYKARLYVDASTGSTRFLSTI